MRNVEAVFLGVFALIVLGAAIFMVARPSLPGPRPTQPTFPGPGAGGGHHPRPDPADSSLACQCFNDAFDLAGQDVDVLSSQYRTGFEMCRATGDEFGGDAWTAGWNARLSAKPFQATCSAWLRQSGRHRR